MNVPLKRNAGLAMAALLASSGTLVCCVLPAVMVALGAGATLAGWVSAIPQLIWLSERKALVFGVAAVVLSIAGFAMARGRRLPCPADPALARACVRLRRFSAIVYAFALVAFLLGCSYAFVLPALT